MPVYHVELSRQTSVVSVDHVTVNNVPAGSKLKAALLAVERAADAYPNWSGATIFDTRWEAVEQLA